MDFSESFLQERQKSAFDESVGGQELNSRKQTVADDEALKTKEEAQNYYQNSSAASVGPSQDVYDYDGAYAEGMNFDGDALTLPNKHIRPGVEVAGYDIATGEKVRSKYKDADGLISNGVAQLKESVTNTEAGTPFEDIEHLGSIALGIQNEGGSYEDFRSELPESWNEDQAKIAWSGAETVNASQALATRIIEGDLDDLAKVEQPVADEEYDPDTLGTNKEWLSAAKLLYSQTESGDIPSDEDLSDWAINEMAYFEWNVEYKALMAIRASMDPATAKALYNMMGIYDNTGSNWEIARLSLVALGWSPSTYIGLGVPALAVKAAGNAAIRAILIASMKTYGKVGAIEGAVYGATEESLGQSVGISAGEENYNPQQVAAMAAGGAAIGGTVGTVAGPLVEKFIGPKVENGIDFFKRELSEVRNKNWADKGNDVEALKGLLRVNRMPQKQIGAVGDVKESLRGSIGTTSRRLKRNKKTGQYVGGPAGLDTPQKLYGLRKRLSDMQGEGAEGRYWYEQSSEAIMKYVGGDLEQADKFVQLLSIYSAQTGVSTNFNFALQAIHQFQSGVPIKVKTSAQDKKALMVLNGSEWPAKVTNPKTTNFYNNLMVEIDPTRVQGATVDIHMMRAFGYTQENPTSAQYAFAEDELNKVADNLNKNILEGEDPWTPHQVQAAIWVAQKSKNEGKPTDITKFDYSDAAQMRSAQVSWESTPGNRTTNHMPEMITAPYKQRAEYHVEVSKAMLDDNGKDMIAMELKMMSPGEFEAPGYWDGEINPGTQTNITAASSGREIKSESKDMLDAYAITKGLLLRQEAVVWHRPFYKQPIKHSNGVDVQIGRSLDNEEILALGKEVEKIAGHGKYVPISTEQGVRFINFDKDFNNKEFHVIIKDALDNAKFNDDPDVEALLFSADANDLSNNWKENPDGQGYYPASWSERPDLQKRVQDAYAKIRPNIEAVDQSFSERYGWTQNKELGTEASSKLVGDVQNALKKNSVDDSDYKGQHTAPMSDSGAPLHDVTGGGEYYPDDVYSNDGLRYYGSGDSFDGESLRIIKEAKGNPDKVVTMYRAVPNEKQPSKLLHELEVHMNQYKRRNNVPSKAENPDNLSGSDWYNWAWDRRAELEGMPDSNAEKISINKGDWVSLSRGYAKNHGEGALNGNYKIISKKVKASELFTNGDSFNEFGYDPKIKGKK